VDKSAEVRERATAADTSPKQELGALRSPKAPNKSNLQLSFHGDQDAKDAKGLPKSGARNEFDSTYYVDWSAPKIGQGSFGMVWQVRGKDGQEDYAVKYMKTKHLRSRFIQGEQHIHARLEHPHIVEMIECFSDMKEIYIVLELCSGGELFDTIADDGPFSETVSANSLGQMLRGVSYLHSVSIVHRDLKAENWLLSQPANLRHATLKLCDFGTARALHADDFAETQVGSPYYVAPEMAQKKTIQ